MPLNINPGDSLKKRMLGATNAVGQAMGGPMGATSRLSAGINQNRINRPQVLPTRGMVPNAGMMPAGMPGMDVGPSMPMPQGPPQMMLPPGQNNVGPSLFRGGPNFPKPLGLNDGGNMNTGGMGIWNAYQNRRVLG